MQKNHFLKVFLPVITIVAIAAAVYFYMQLSELKTNPQAVAEKETAALVAKVGNLVFLPEGETPTVATVSDPEALRSQPFFANAQVGDKVLIYTTARKAILYNPTLNKIVEVAPINIGEGAGATAQ
ncbi:hypothetical protein A2914_01260 [Candidatus Nomurabacteria bacterium RIFCSPLOWO2_01_FULL_41_21]|uniref:Uncharacterized protein n=2 Tax=Candidatus Nomuraibacteriota TaxID=1752729 RepID=A0A1F6V2W7_9BACT|nr:MAG: hypothetical protein A2733_02350 [Candidatus Nomurabacteria bacterium RIFCSPHIGHO2_01_FULL_40_20]OGI87940.1 MAG: hypothetical protein A2914_01260 [Candidatus Nomurabacteria bacterium RIFCSPLOWO2_01_FULL_41_21]